MIYDVVIIGAGITGCMTAYRLAAYDVKTAVAEAHSDVSMGATKANSAIVHAGFDAECGTLKAKLNVAACAEMPELARKLNVEFHQCGSLVAAFNEHEEEHLQELYQRGVNNGVPNLEIVRGERLREMEPNLSPEVTAALWAPTAGIISPYGLAIAAAESAAVHGTDFYFNYRVNSIVKENDIFTVSCGDGRIIKAHRIVNAAGVYGDYIADIAGEVDFPIRIIPRRGEYMLLDKDYDTAKHVLFSVPTDRGKGILVSPTVHGNVIVGPNAYKIDDRDDTSTTAEGLQEISDGAKRLVPSVNLRSVITSFSGVRPTPTIYDFYIENSKEISGLVHAVGVESPGLASGPAVGTYIVEKLAETGLELKPRKDYTGERPPVVKFDYLSDDEKLKLIESNPTYAKIVCRCETITEGEIIAAVKRPIPALDLDAVKRRVRAGMGRCQGGFCSPRVTAIIAREAGMAIEEVTKRGGNSRILSY
jgi:Predicted dehydrogenase